MYYVYNSMLMPGCPDNSRILARSQWPYWNCITTYTAALRRYVK